MIYEHVPTRHEIYILKYTHIILLPVVVLVDVSENEVWHPLVSDNNALKELYGTNFFKDISINLVNGQLVVSVVENPIIQSIEFLGIKTKKIIVKQIIQYGFFIWDW